MAVASPQTEEERAGEGTVADEVAASVAAMAAHKEKLAASKRSRGNGNTGNTRNTEVENSSTRERYGNTEKESQKVSVSRVSVLPNSQFGKTHHPGRTNLHGVNHKRQSNEQRQREYVVRHVEKHPGATISDLVKALPKKIDIGRRTIWNYIYGREGVPGLLDEERLVVVSEGKPGRAATFDIPRGNGKTAKRKNGNTGEAK
jgi:hypothetical protein